MTREDVIVVPRLLRFRGFLHLTEIHVVDQPSILPDTAVLCVKVVHWDLPHLGNYRLCFVGAGGSNGPEIMTDSRINAGLSHRGHGSVPLKEAFRPRAAFFVAIPVECAHGF